MTLRRWGAPDIVGELGAADAARRGARRRGGRRPRVRAAEAVGAPRRRGRRDRARPLAAHARRVASPPNTARPRRLTAHARPHLRRRSSWRAPRWPAAFIALAHGALWAASALDGEGAALEPYALARVSIALWVFVLG